MGAGGLADRTPDLEQSARLWQAHANNNTNSSRNNSNCVASASLLVASLPWSQPTCGERLPHAGHWTARRNFPLIEPEPDGPDRHTPNLSSLPALCPPPRTSPSHPLVTAGHASPLLLDPGLCPNLLSSSGSHTWIVLEFGSWSLWTPSPSPTE